MKKYLYILTICLLSCSSNKQVLENDDNCNPDKLEPISLYTIKEQILGNWEYNQSFHNDTCFQIDKLGDLPLNFSFKKTEIESIRSKNPRLFDIGKEMMLFGIECYHDSIPFGNKSYLVARPISREDRKILQVMHYVTNGMGKGYTYYLEHLTEDTLIIRNQRNYKLNYKKITAIKHIYIKQNSNLK